MSKTRRRTLATTRITPGIDVIAQTRHRNRALAVFGFDLGGDGVAGTAGAGAERIAALDHKPWLDAMKRQVVVESLAREEDEIVDR